MSLVSLENYSKWNQDQWFDFVTSYDSKAVNEETRKKMQNKEFNDLMVKVGLFGGTELFNMIPSRWRTEIIDHSWWDSYYEHLYTETPFPITRVLKDSGDESDEVLIKTEIDDDRPSLRISIYRDMNPTVAPLTSNLIRDVKSSKELSCNNFFPLAKIIKKINAIEKTVFCCLSENCIPEKISDLVRQYQGYTSRVESHFAVHLREVRRITYSIFYSHIDAIPDNEIDSEHIPLSRKISGLIAQYLDGTQLESV